MRVHIATDHAGFELKEKIVADLREKGYDVVDHGAHVYDALDDYPPFCIEAAQAVVDEPGSLGVVIGGSGNGEQMAANCVQGVRAALVWSDATARLAREHNDANMMAVGARQHSEEEVLALIVTFLETPFSGDERHQRRIDLMAAYERSVRVRCPPRRGGGRGGAAAPPAPFCVPGLGVLVSSAPPGVSRFSAPASWFLHNLARNSPVRVSDFEI